MSSVILQALFIICLCLALSSVGWSPGNALSRCALACHSCAYHPKASTTYKPIVVLRHRSRVVLPGVYQFLSCKRKVILAFPDGRPTFCGLNASLNVSIWMYITWRAAWWIQHLCRMFKKMTYTTTNNCYFSGVLVYIVHTKLYDVLLMHV